ncbi:MAG: helix-turn-helix domain-containing protein [Clostridium sp.]|nr:helix-turn-helix domain-containing protein [Clostridium sp.]
MLDISKEIKRMMFERDVNISRLAELLNTSQPNLSAKLKRNDFRISELEKISLILGYEVKIEFLQNKKG